LGSRGGEGWAVPSPDKSRANERATLSIRRLRGLPIPLFAALVSACALLLAAAGCGAPEGVEEGATVSIYVSDALCGEAKREIDRQGSRVGAVRLRTICVEDGSRLAAIGAAARRATEDSASVAYIGTPDPTAVRFSEPILEEAGIARISASSGDAGAARLLRALRRADTSESLRESLLEELG
jgi:hypothetical protein